MENSLPVYQLILEDENTEGVTAISLVFSPANEQEFVLFNQHKENINLSVDVEGIVTGPVLIPNQLIYRNQNGEEYFTKMDEKTIKQLAYNFIKKHNQNDITLQHMNEVDGVTVVETWLTGENDKAKDFGFDVPEGTWMASMKIDNQEILNKIKSGEVRGFSVEAWLSRLPVKMESQDKEISEMTDQELEELYDEIIKNFKIR